jgi:hypothetical protein
MGATYDIYIGTAKEPAFDWRARGVGVAQITFRCHVESGLQPLLDFVRAIEAGELEGRQLDWGSWIAPVRKADLAAFAARRGWKLSAAALALPADLPYYLVGVEG